MAMLQYIKIYHVKYTGNKEYFTFSTYTKVYFDAK